MNPGIRLTLHGHNTPSQLCFVWICWLFVGAKYSKSKVCHCLAWFNFHSSTSTLSLFISCRLPCCYPPFLLIATTARDVSYHTASVSPLCCPCHLIHPHSCSSAKTAFTDSETTSQVYHSAVLPPPQPNPPSRHHHGQLPSATLFRTCFTLCLVQFCLLFCPFVRKIGTLSWILPDRLVRVLVGTVTHLFVDHPLLAGRTLMIWQWPQSLFSGISCSTHWWQMVGYRTTGQYDNRCI
jgi:hypothetical protein